MDFEKLKEPFPETDIEWRLQSCGEKNGKLWGKALAYITSRAVQERLDEVCGPDNWQVSIHKEGDAYLSTLSIRVKHEDGSIEWLSRTDGADATDIEPVKGGISGAIKRSAVLFGIGRYLYTLKDNWAIIDENGKFSGKTKEGKYFKWNPPKLPPEALPKDDSSKSKGKTTQSVSKEDMEKAASIKTKLLDYEDIIPEDKWKKIDEAVAQGNVIYLEQILDWAKSKSEKTA